MITYFEGDIPDDSETDDSYIQLNDKEIILRRNKSGYLLSLAGDIALISGIIDYIYLTAIPDLQYIQDYDRLAFSLGLAVTGSIAKTYGWIFEEILDRK